MRSRGYTDGRTRTAQKKVSREMLIRRKKGGRTGSAREGGGGSPDKKETVLRQQNVPGSASLQRTGANAPPGRPAAQSRMRYEPSRKCKKHVTGTKQSWSGENITTHHR